MIPESYVAEGRRLVSAPLDDDRRWELGDLAVGMVDELVAGRDLSGRRLGEEASFILQEYAYLLPDHVRPDRPLRYQVLRGCYEQSRKVPAEMRVEGRSYNDHKPARADHLADDELRRLFLKTKLIPEGNAAEETSVPPKLASLVNRVERLLSHSDIDAALEAYTADASKKDRRRIAHLRRERRETIKESERLHAQAEQMDGRPQHLTDAMAKLVDARHYVQMAAIAVEENVPAPLVAAELQEKLVRLAGSMMAINDILQQVLRGEAPTPDPFKDKERAPTHELPPGT